MNLEFWKAGFHMDLGISGRMALITGASRGIGAETCKILANEGVRIIAVARSAEDLEILENSIPSKGHYFWTIDLEVEDGLSQLFKKIDEASLDISIIVLFCSTSICCNSLFCCITSRINFGEISWLKLF